MITRVENFAPDSDIIVIHTSYQEKIIVERYVDGSVHITIDNLLSPNTGKAYMRAFILGKEGEE